MNEFLKVLLNIRSLRAACRDLTLEQLEEGLAKLTSVVEERRENEASDRQQREDRLRKIEEYKNMLLADGIEPSELFQMVATESEKTGKRAPRPAKYRYIDDKTGEEKTWTGQGRQPSAIAKAIEQGQAIEDFLINK